MNKLIVFQAIFFKYFKEKYRSIVDFILIGSNFSYLFMALISFLPNAQCWIQL